MNCQFCHSKPTFPCNKFNISDLKIIVSDEGQTTISESIKDCVKKTIPDSLQEVLNSVSQLTVQSASASKSYAEVARTGSKHQ